MFGQRILLLNACQARRQRTRIEEFLRTTLLLLHSLDPIEEAKFHDPMKCRRRTQRRREW